MGTFLVNDTNDQDRLRCIALFLASGLPPDHGAGYSVFPAERTGFLPASIGIAGRGGNRTISYRTNPGNILSQTDHFSLVSAIFFRPYP
jgi:hypothetical protein